MASLLQWLEPPTNLFTTTYAVRILFVPPAAVQRLKRLPTVYQDRVVLMSVFPQE